MSGCLTSLRPGHPSLALGPQSHFMAQNGAHVPSEAFLGNPRLCYLRFPACSVKIASPTLRGLPSPRFQSLLEFRSRFWGELPTAPAVPCSPVTPRHVGRAGQPRHPAQPPFGADGNHVGPPHFRFDKCLRVCCKQLLASPLPRKSCVTSGKSLSLSEVKEG